MKKAKKSRKPLIIVIAVLAVIAIILGLFAFSQLTQYSAFSPLSQKIVDINPDEVKILSIRNGDGHNDDDLVTYYKADKEFDEILSQLNAFTFKSFLPAKLSGDSVDKSYTLWLLMSGGREYYIPFGANGILIRRLWYTAKEPDYFQRLIDLCGF